MSVVVVDGGSCPVIANGANTAEPARRPELPLLTSKRALEEYMDRRLASSWGQRIHDRNDTTASTSTITSAEQEKGGKDDGMELHRLIKSVEDEEGWSVVRKRIISHPSEALEWDRRGRTCLAAACSKPHVPLDVVETLWKKCCFGMEFECDKNGQSVLLIALNGRASMTVLRHLCSCPDLVTVRDHRGNTALHEVCSDSFYFHQDEPHGLELMRLMVKTAPQIVASENNAGKTALHAAVEKGSSLQVIKLLAESCPDAVLKDGCGMTPLLLAIWTSADPLVIRTLVEANPLVTRRRGARGMYPLREAVEVYYCHNPDIVEWLCTCPEAVLDLGSDRHGRNLLSVHLSQSTHTVHPRIVRCLLKQAPQAACSCGAKSSSSSPLSICYQRFVEAVSPNRLRHRLLHRRGDRQQEQEEDIQVVRQRRGKNKWWKITCITLQAVASLEEDAEPSLLRAAIATEAPVPVLEQIISENPDSVRQADGKGRYPLHLVCMRKQRDFASKDSTLKDTLLTMFLKFDTGVASLADGEGRYPLSVAVEHGGISLAALQQLVLAYPEAVVALDTKYGLYPFLLAAAVTNKDETDKSILGTILELLLARPDLIKARSDGV